MLPRVSVCLPFVYFADFARANADDPNPGDLPVTGGGPSENMFASAFLVLFVLVVIMIMILLLTRFLAKKNRQFFAHRSIRLVAGIPFGQNKSLQIVEIGGKIYILGVGNDIRLLEKIDDPALVEQLLGKLESDYNKGVLQIPILDGTIKFLRRKLRVHRLHEKNGQDQTAQQFQQILYEKLRTATLRNRSVHEQEMDANREDRSDQT